LRKLDSGQFSVWVFRVTTQRRMRTHSTLPKALFADGQEAGFDGRQLAHVATYVCQSVGHGRRDRRNDAKLLRHSSTAHLSAATRICHLSTPPWREPQLLPHLSIISMANL
jgi:hypothetical protein